MGFVDELRARNTSAGPLTGIGSNTSSSSFTGRSSSEDLEGVLNTIMPFMHQIRNRNMDDFKHRAAVGEQMSMRQTGLQRAFDPQNNGPGGMQMNTVYQPPTLDPNTITPAQKFAMGQDTARLGLERRRVEQADRFGEERSSLNRDKLALDTQKSDQIYDTKIRTIEEKSRVDNAKLEQAINDGVRRGNDAASLRQIQEYRMLAEQSRAELAAAMREMQFAETQRSNFARDAARDKELENAGFQYETITDNQGNTQRRLIRRGQGAVDAEKNASDPAGLR